MFRWLLLYQPHVGFQSIIELGWELLLRSFFGLIQDLLKLLRQLRLRDVVLQPFCNAVAGFRSVARFEWALVISLFFIELWASFCSHKILSLEFSPSSISINWFNEAATFSTSPIACSFTLRFIFTLALSLSFNLYRRPISLTEGTLLLSQPLSIFSLSNDSFKHYIPWFILFQLQFQGISMTILHRYLLDIHEHICQYLKLKLAFNSSLDEVQGHILLDVSSSFLLFDICWCNYCYLLWCVRCLTCFLNSLAQVAEGIFQFGLDLFEPFYCGYNKF